MKKCSTCNIKKSLDEFYTDISKSCGYRSTCKECASIYSQNYSNKKGEKYRRDIRYKTTYGITLEEYNNLFQLQNGKCKICERSQLEFKRRFAVDHCHSTNEVRGLLCQNCNTGLGNFKDNMVNLQKANTYLKEFNNNNIMTKVVPANDKTDLQCVDPGKE